MNENEPAGQSEGVQIVRVDDLAGNGHLGVGVPHQALADPVHVFADQRIVEHARLPLHFLGQLLAQRNFLFDGIEIDALADIAIADLVDILLLVVSRTPGSKVRQ